MKKIEFLTASLPYELKFKNKNEGSIEKLSGVDTYIAANWTKPQYPDGTLLVYSSIDYSSMWGIDEIKPIVRHPSDLIKPITQANYNGGEPFVPIVELAKIVSPHYDWHLHQSGKYATVKDIYGNDFNFEYDEAYNLFLRENTADSIDQLQLFQLLWKWHFWPNMPEGEDVVWVTNEFNPYK